MAYVSVNIDIDEFTVGDILEYLSEVLGKPEDSRVHEKGQIRAWIKKNLGVDVPEVKTDKIPSVLDLMRDEFYIKNRNKITLEMLEGLIK